MEKQLETALRSVIAFLEASGYRYAIIGGIALSRWGVVRATYDVDIKVVVPDTDYARIRTTIESAFPQRARQNGPENPLIVPVVVGQVIVDFLLALPGYEEQIIERAVLQDFGGWSAWICSAEDLIIQKVVAGRVKDWMDVDALLSERLADLDEAYIEDWIGQFAEVLEKPELMSQYQQLRIKAESLGS